MADHDPNISAGPDTAKTATWAVIEKMTPEARAAWRVVDIPRASADERNLPANYPMGWAGLCYIDELNTGEVRPMRAFGQELAVWRGEDGAARVIDAYCPHYGAHLGKGGRVHGNLIECPFHSWRLDGDGITQESLIPPASRRKPAARAASKAGRCAS